MKEKREIILFFTRLLMLAVMLAVLFGVIFGMTSAKNQDMSPKICAGDLLLYYRLERKYSDRDVVVFKNEGTLYTGRIVAREKDKVEITDKNENQVEEDFKVIRDGLKLLELDYLGGSGSRGYGKVAFENLKATTVFGSYDVKTLNELLTAEV